MNVRMLIQKFGLQPHPEGGFYKETYRTKEMIKTKDGRTRNIGTAIYYLLEDDNKSHFHRLKSDELWFFHQGNTLEIVLIEDEKLSTINLGNEVEKEEVAQTIIPANTWFAAKVKSGKGYALVSCTVSPGFDFIDFEMGKKEDLIQQYPHLRKVIEEYALSE